MATLRAARGEGSPPRQLVLAWHAQRWHTLPEAGGQLDQPAGLLNTMARLQNVYDAAKAYYGADDTAGWANANPDMFELYAWARKVEREHGR